MNVTHRIEYFFWKWLYECKPCEKMTLRIELSSSHDSKKWTFFFLLEELNLLFFITRRIEPLFLDMTLRIELSFSHDSKNWTFFFLILEELNLLFFYYSKNWTFFQKKYPSRIEPFKKCLEELVLFCMTHRIEFFFFAIFAQCSSHFHSKSRWGKLLHSAG